jgi:flagellar biosynthesis/type III secretory pathway ATPase
LQIFFLRGEDRPWTQDRLAALSAIDTVIHLSRERIRANVYPAVGVPTSRSRLIETNAVSNEHAMICERARQAIAALWAADRDAGADKPMLERP